jgi:uncharacterized protein (DUF2235 family)
MSSQESRHLLVLFCDGTGNQPHQSLDKCTNVRRLYESLDSTKGTVQKRYLRGIGTDGGLDNQRQQVLGYGKVAHASLE